MNAGESVNCQNCRSENPDGSVFCNTCGGRIAVLRPGESYSGEPSISESELIRVEYPLGHTASYTREGAVARATLGIVVALFFGLVMLVVGYSRSEYGIVFGGTLWLAFGAIIALRVFVFPVKRSPP
ncbi:MAG: zinc ribbon domain-containing protein [Candidatus Thermoplasmatota archaeon]